MFVFTLRRVATFALSVLITQVLAEYKLPDVTIQAFKPKGFRASIPDDPKIRLFMFRGNVNKELPNYSNASLTGQAHHATDGYWVVEDPVELKVGDVINYYVMVAFDRGSIEDRLTHVVSVLEDRTALPTGATGCLPTLTKVRGGEACAGQTIFEDTFDSFKEDVWQIEQYIPINHPEFPFVSYQRLANNPTVSVVDGKLYISPRQQQYQIGFNSDSIYSGTLDLFDGCTSVAEACRKVGRGADILPPLVSGRITSKAFAFTYGTVHVRAKLPQGDWLYPEILLEPFLKKYGSLRYASGVLKIASARGNKELTDAEANEYGNNFLYGGPILDYECRKKLLVRVKTEEIDQHWGDEFHVYSMRWTPDQIVLSVDEEEWGRIETGSKRLYQRLPRSCRDLPRTLLKNGSPMAPFDDHFYITLGMAAGGISEFPDEVSPGTSKPWQNKGRKALFQFWQDLPNWFQTWDQPDLIIDYIKVVAL